MEKTINIRGTQLFYTVEGEGMPVILMHGWGCNHSTLKSIEAQLTPGFKVYNVDFPGFGGSNEPSAVWGVEEYTSLIEEFARQEHIESPILLGHSFGGRVGILFASRNKVHKLILVDAAGVKPRRSLRYYYKVYSYKAIKHALLFFLGKKRGETALNSYRAKVGALLGSMNEFGLDDSDAMALWNRIGVLSGRLANAIPDNPA